MAWRDNLLPASFRGATFYVDSSATEGGRRNAVHEFPLRDTAYVEDLGLKNRGYKLTGYVLATTDNGMDYFPDRDALIGALEAGQPGSLVHPYLGAIQVNVDKYSCRETLEEGGLATFSLDFVDAGANASPFSQQDGQGNDEDQADGLDDDLGNDFDDPTFAVIGQSASVRASAAQLLASVEAAFTTLVAASGIDPGLATLEAALTVTSTATEIAQAVVAFAQAYAKKIIASWTPFDDTLSSRGPQPVADQSYGLQALSNWTFALPPAADITTTPDAVQIATNIAETIALVNGVAVTAWVRIAARASYASQEDAEAARDAISDAIDTQATAAADAGKDTTFAQWKAMASAISSDLTARGKQVPNVVSYPFAVNRTALDLAQMLYQDGTRAGELVARNAAPFPLFMPTTVVALAS